MRSTLRERWDGWKYSTERSLAPHVDDAWAEGLVVELRLQGVGGPAIGEALSEVESHCAESGESALDAFGDAAGYARSLQLPRSEDETTRSILAALAPMGLQIVPMLLTLWAFEDWVEGGALAITSGQVLSIALLVAAIAGLVRFSEPVLRTVVEHPVLAFLAIMAFLAVSVVAQLLWTHELTTVPSAPVLAASVLALLGGTVWQLTRARSGVDEDLITSPLDGTDETAGSPASAARTSRLMVLASLTIPVYTVFSLALTWWIAHQ